MAGKIIADTIEASGSQISLNVGNVTILTASSTGLTLTPTSNVNINIASGSAAFTTANITTANIASISGAVVATQANQETATSTSTLVTPGRQQYHPSAGKAWIVFNGTGTPAINANYNVSSLTDLATGRYTVNFTTAFSSVNYSAVGMLIRDLSTGIATTAQDTSTVPTASGFSVMTQSSGTPTDFTFVHMQFFGDQ